MTSEFHSLLNELRNADKNIIRIGLFDTSKIMDHVCGSFSVSHPEVSQEYTMVSPEDWLSALDSLRSGELDILEHVDVPKVHENGLGFTPLIKSKCVCFVHSTHPLANKKCIEPEDLSGLLIGIHDETLFPGLRTFLESKAPNSILVNCISGTFSAFNICNDGGVFLMTEEFIPKFRPLRSVPFNCPLTCTYGITYKSPPSPLVQLFIDNSQTQFP